MIITKQTVADQIGGYLRHGITLAQLVDWAENALMEGEFDEKDAATISAVVARLGVADVRAFGLTWADCAPRAARRRNRNCLRMRLHRKRRTRRGRRGCEHRPAPTRATRPSSCQPLTPHPRQVPVRK